MKYKIDKVYDSSRGEVCYDLACGYISETVIHFEKEAVIVHICAQGRVTFLDMEQEELAVGVLPAMEGGRQLYQQVCCQVQDGAILLHFPIYQWIDNYPHCDSEHDRWDTRQIGQHRITYHAEEAQLTVTTQQ